MWTKFSLQNSCTNSINFKFRLLKPINWMLAVKCFYLSSVHWTSKSESIMSYLDRLDMLVASLDAYVSESASNAIEYYRNLVIENDARYRIPSDQSPIVQCAYISLTFNDFSSWQILSICPKTIPHSTGMFITLTLIYFIKMQSITPH